MAMITNNPSRHLRKALRWQTLALNKERTFATSATVSSQLKPSYGLWIDGKEVDAAANEKVVVADARAHDSSAQHGHSWAQWRA